MVDFAKLNTQNKEVNRHIQVLKQICIENKDADTITTSDYINDKIDDLSIAKKVIKELCDYSWNINYKNGFKE